MKGLDTNVLVRFLTRDDAAQAGHAERKIAALARRGEAMRIDIVVLCELVWVLRSGYGFDGAAIAGAVEALTETAAFEVEDRELVREAVALQRAGSADLPDCLIGLRNRRSGCDTTLTFDRALRSVDSFSLL